AGELRRRVRPRARALPRGRRRPALAGVRELRHVPQLRSARGKIPGARPRGERGGVAVKLGLRSALTLGCAFVLAFSSAARADDAKPSSKATSSKASDGDEYIGWSSL